MGICHSSSSAWKQESDENIVYVVGKEASDCDNGGGIRRLSSLYSRQGRKGPNQDSAILCQGYGVEDGVFCGVFDGHGKNGDAVSRIVRDYLPSLLLSHRNNITIAAEDHDSLQKCSKDGESFPIISSELFEEWKEASISGFKDMDRELKLLTNLDCSYSGTTAVTIIKQGEDVIVANLGDSRAVLGTLTKEGRLKAVQLTVDLKPSVHHFTHHNKLSIRFGTSSAVNLMRTMYYGSTFQSRFETCDSESLSVLLPSIHITNKSSNKILIAKDQLGCITCSLIFTSLTKDQGGLESLYGVTLKRSGALIVMPNKGHKLKRIEPRKQMVLVRLNILVVQYRILRSNDD